MKKVFERPKSLKRIPFRYCPGCGHSLIHRIIAECIDNLGIRERVIGIAPIGCAVFAYDYFYFDILEVPHGRPPAAAAAMKRVQPDRIIFAYQGDGDLAAIGTGEVVHAAARGDNITIIFVNNATYGMTGGQMAPTTLLGQKTTTTRKGRDSASAGYPLKISEILATIEGSAFVARVSVDSSTNLLTAKKAVEKAFRYQIENKGFSLVEILSQCPTDWWISPEDSLAWIKTHMMPVYGIGVLKDKYNGAERS
jgi:2-oxoglutarate/2-oxoacid ferredoxin oxidoreductase subunit beta